jgi:hypothetical protein
MLKPAFISALICLLLPGSIHSQDFIKKSPFFVVDSFSKTVRYKHDLNQLTKELTDPYAEQLLKARAIFIWITDNIKYDYKFINAEKEVKIPECESGPFCEQVHLVWEKKYLQKVLKKKKAICDGYARLFKKMCDIAGIPCEMVSGYTRTKPYQIGNPGSVNHSWNVLLIDRVYHFVDPTWAAGGCEEDEETGKLLYFQKHYNEYYWFTPFHELTRNHYPSNGKWVMEPGYTKEKYAANPYYASSILSDINLRSPASGIIKAAKGDTLHFKFDYKGNITLLQVNSNVFRNPALGEWEKKPWHRKKWIPNPHALEKQQYTPFRKNGDTYEFDYLVTDGSLYYIEVLFEHERALKFNVSIEGPQ